MADFKATHVYDGGDWACLFRPGTEVVFVGNYEDPHFPEYNDLAAYYSDGITTQAVLRSCVKELK